MHQAHYSTGPTWTRFKMFQGLPAAQRGPTGQYNVGSDVACDVASLKRPCGTRLPGDAKGEGHGKQCKLQAEGQFACWHCFVFSVVRQQPVIQCPDDY